LRWSINCYRAHNMWITFYRHALSPRGFTKLLTVVDVDYILLKPIADRMAQHLEIISKNFQFSTRRTRILMGFIIDYLVLIVNPVGRILVRWKSFRNNLEILCHPICNRLYYLRLLVTCARVYMCVRYTCANILSLGMYIYVYIYIYIYIHTHIHRYIYI